MNAARKCLIIRGYLAARPRHVVLNSAILAFIMLDMCGLSALAMPHVRAGKDPKTATLILYLVESVREGRRTRQRIAKNLGRNEAVLAGGDLECLLTATGFTEEFEEGVLQAEKEIKCKPFQAARDVLKELEAIIAQNEGHGR